MDRAGLTVIFSSSSEDDVKEDLSNKKKHSIRKKVKLYLRKRKNYLGFNHVKAVVVNNLSHLNKLPVPYQTFIPNGVICSRIPFQWNRPYCAWISSLKQIKRPELLLELANQFKGRNIDFKIGRASCRERVVSYELDEAWKITIMMDQYD